MKIELPAQTVPVDTKDAGVDPIWYERLQQLATISNLFSEVTFATMTTGQSLVWDAVRKKFKISE